MSEELTVQGRVRRIGTRGMTLLTLRADELTTVADPRGYPAIFRLDPQVYPHALLTQIDDVVVLTFDQQITATWRRGALAAALPFESSAPLAEDTVPAMAITLFRNLTLEAELSARAVRQETPHVLSAADVSE